MSAGTIRNLQNALDCSDKCDCCEKLQNQINKLTSKVGGLDQDIKNIIPRVNSHETRIKKIESGGGNKQDYNLNLLRRRINIMGKQLEAIERYINALDNAGKTINNIFKKAIKDLFKIKL